jgi:hypothetical protein
MKMTPQSTTPARALAATLILTMMVAHSLAVAGDTPPVVPETPGQVDCSAGKADCPAKATLRDRKPSPARPARQVDCTQDSQNCPDRDRSQRSRADSEARDRHAGRD